MGTTYLSWGYFYIYPRKPSKWDIYYIYGTLSWYMQQHTPETETFFRPRIQYTPSTSAFFVLGLRPRTKNASVSGVYCSSDEKMPRFRGYIAAYTPPKHRITLHIYRKDWRNSTTLSYSTQPLLSDTFMSNLRHFHTRHHNF